LSIDWPWHPIAARRWRTGLKLYGRFDGARFRQIVLLLLLAFGISLIVPVSILR
jgi:hypothetical protein